MVHGRVIFLHGLATNIITKQKKKGIPFTFHLLRAFSQGSNQIQNKSNPAEVKRMMEVDVITRTVQGVSEVKYTMNPRWLQETVSFA